MRGAFNAGIVNHLIAQTTNLSMHRALTASTNHYILSGLLTQTVLLET